MEYITSTGDTFDTIAYRMYSDSELIKPIIEANPDYSDVVVFDHGTKLTIPDIDTTNDSAYLPPWRK